MACNDPIHEIFADVQAYMDQERLYRIEVQHGTDVVRRRIPFYNEAIHNEVCDLIEAARISAVRQVASGQRNGFDLMRIDRDAERLIARSKGKRFGAAQRRLDTIGKGRVVERVAGTSKPKMDADTFFAAILQRP